ncbi:MAG: hypothetical protein HC802_07180 [Caldilineaceae bacterium]|nr:hypothetical protein [Caldilineaceae bacterium]
MSNWKDQAEEERRKREEQKKHADVSNLLLWMPIYNKDGNPIEAPKAGESAGGKSPKR